MSDNGKTVVSVLQNWDSGWAGEEPYLAWDFIEFDSFEDAQHWVDQYNEWSTEISERAAREGREGYADRGWAVVAASAAKPLAHFQQLADEESGESLGITAFLDRDRG
jgi:hypothetical protein